MINQLMAILKVKKTWCFFDAASVMKKMEREMGFINQLSHCHGIYLAVCNTLYEKKSLARETI